MIAWYLIGALFLVGIWGVVGSRNMIRKVMSLTLANSAVVLLFVFGASLSGDVAPILSGKAGTPVDPLPHALMLTAIVVGICVVAFALVLVNLLYRRFGTLDMSRIERKVWHGDE